MNHDIHVVALVKGPERYVVMYTAATVNDACRTLGRWAADPQLSLTWAAAAAMSMKIRAGLPPAAPCAVPGKSPRFSIQGG